MNIAFLGTGLMGYPMAKRLIDAGHQLSVYNRTISKAQGLEDIGATVCDKPYEAISSSECIILMLSDARAIEEVLFGEADGQALEDKTIIQMGTIAPANSIAIQKKVYSLGGEYLEAPVLGSRTEAEEGRLLLMVGATEERFNKWLSILQVFGQSVRHIGDVGKAAGLKLALNQLIASHAASFSLSLGIVEKNDIAVGQFMDILKESSLFAPMYEKKLSNWQNRKYDNPNFPAKHLLKDVKLVVEEAKDKDLRTDVVSAIERILEDAIEQGLENKDYSSIFNVINNISND